MLIGRKLDTLIEELKRAKEKLGQEIQPNYFKLPTYTITQIPNY